MPPPRTIAFACVLLAAGVSPAAGQEMPPLDVRVAFAPQLRARAGWYARLACAVNRANRLISSHIGRSLRLAGKVPWHEGGPEDSLKELRADLGRRFESRPSEVVLGITLDASPTVRETAPVRVMAHTDEGLASYTRGHVVVKAASSDLCGTYRLIAHEFAHVFGAVHREGARYLMDAGSPGEEIDPLNRELLAMHRGREFGPDKAPLSADDLPALWSLSSADLAAPETWVTAAALARRMEAPAFAARFYDEALSHDPRYLPALAARGQLHLMAGELESALRTYRAALAEAPESGLFHNNVAAISSSLGDLDRAVEHLRAALRAGFDVDPRFIARIERLTGEKIR